jgi:hydroxyacylglutathione hydrolase
MIVEHSSHPQFVSNTYLVADSNGGPAFFVDAGGPVRPLIEAAERLGLTPTHVLLTHHHFDHVSDVAELRQRWPELQVLISATERQLLDSAAGRSYDGGGGGDAAGRSDDGGGGGDAAGGGDGGAADSPGADMGAIEAGEKLRFGELEVRALHTPGHTAGMLSFLVTHGPDAAVFTGDTLFKGSVGGVRAPGHSTYADLRTSIMDTLMGLAPDTVVHPGHSEPTTVAREWDHNSFIRVWRGLDPEGTQACTALGEPATLVLLGADYDGGTKAWIRWPDGSDDIVPGSRVEQPAQPA